MKNAGQTAAGMQHIHPQPGRGPGGRGAPQGRDLPPPRLIRLGRSWTHPVREQDWGEAGQVGYGTPSSARTLGAYARLYRINEGTDLINTYK